MPQVNAYLNFDGNTAEAMRFYERVLGGTLSLMTNGQSPIADQIPAEHADRVLHAHLEFDGGVLMASDSMAGHTYQGMHGFGLALTYETVDRAKKVFDALAEGGKVSMPMTESFWAKAFGMLVDRYGTPWLINGEMIPMQT